MSALPEWPEEPKSADILSDIVFTRGRLDAALARLRLARPYMRHLEGKCELTVTWVHASERVCTCGLAELLADLLPPGEGR